MKENNKALHDNHSIKQETAVLVGLISKEQTEEQTTEYLDELEFLALTDGVKVLKRFTQKLPHPEGKTYVGKGKLEEIKAYTETHWVDLIIIDDEISPLQHSVPPKLFPSPRHSTACNYARKGEHQTDPN